MLDGLVSNVDWLPTILSFANLIPNDSTTVLFKNTNDENDDMPLTLDGYNIYNYIMTFDASPIRDHIMFHMRPNLTINHTFSKSINDYSLNDFSEIALIFYDDDQTLWKYLNVTQSDNPVGSPRTNAGWCIADDDINSNASYTTLTNDSFAVNYGLFDLTSDVAETINYFDENCDDINSAKINISKLTSIVTEKVKLYATGESKDYLYGNFHCFTVEMDEPQIAANETGAWMPFLDETEFNDMLITGCDLDDTHMMYTLYTTDFTWPTTNLFETEISTRTSDSSNIHVQSRIPLMKPRHFAPHMVLDEHSKLTITSNQKKQTSASNDDDVDSETISVPVITMIAIILSAIVFLCLAVLPDFLLKRRGYRQVSDQSI